MALPIEPLDSNPSLSQGDKRLTASPSAPSARREGESSEPASTTSQSSPLGWTWYRWAVLAGLVGVTFPLTISAIGIVVFRLAEVYDPAVLQPLVLLSEVVGWVGVFARVCSVLFFWRAFRIGVGRKSMLIWMTSLCFLGEILLLAGVPLGVLLLGTGVLTMLAYVNLAATYRRARRHILFNRALRTALLAFWLFYFIAVAAPNQDSRTGVLAESGGSGPHAHSGERYMLLVALEIITVFALLVLKTIALRIAQANRREATVAMVQESAFR